MLNHQPLLARFASVPCMVAPEMVDRFESCLRSLSSVEGIDKMVSYHAAADDGFWPPADSWLARYRPYVVQDGVLQIPVKGVLLHDFSFQVGSFATGYEYIERAFARGMEDGTVRGIALVIDSPGGEVAGNFDLVDKMFTSRGKKPVKAFAAEFAYSAAYSIASVADKLAVTRTGGVGSIGVMTMHADWSKAMDQAGLKITFIFAGKHKVDGNSYEPLPKETAARIQARIDSLYDVFVSTVARNRSMDEQAIRDTEALTFTAAEAVSNGLADEVGVLDDALAAYAADLSNHDDGEEQMSKQDESAANQAAVTSARAEGVEAGKKDGHAAGLAEGAKVGATTERARINAILASDEGKKRPKAAMAAAMDTDMTVDQATAFLAKLPEEKQEQAANGESGFERAMNQGDQPNLGAGQDAPQGDAAKVASILGDQRAAMGIVPKAKN